MTDSDRLGALDPALEAVARPAAALPDELFAFADALLATPTLRRILTDAATGEDRKLGLVQALLGSASQGAVSIVSEAVGMRWDTGRRLAYALERQAIRAELRAAGDGVDDVEDELFRLGRLVDASPELRNALADEIRTVADRQDLIAGLLTGHASDTTVKLARRAVADRDRAFSTTLDTYVDLAAQLRNQVVATVRVARELDAAQLRRLKAALAAQVGREVSVQQVVEPDVLGGVRVELGDEVVEGTVAARLDDARRHFGVA